MCLFDDNLFKIIPSKTTTNILQLILHMYLQNCYQRRFCLFKEFLEVVYQNNQ